MAISEAAKLAQFKEWRATLVIGETTYTLLDLPSRSLGTGQERGTCTCKVSVFPAEKAGTSGYIDITLNNETERFFTGKVDVRPISNNPPEYQVTLIDNQSRLKKQVGEAITWSNVSFTAAVRQLLNKAGIPDEEISSIHDPGSPFTIAPVYEVKNESGDHYNDLLEELLEFAGCAINVGPDGMVSIVDAPGWPEDTPTVTYANAATLTEYGIEHGNRTIGGSENVVSSFKAYGPRRPDNTIPDATFTVSGVTGEKDEEEYRLIQTEEAAEAIARREIQKRNRESTIVEVSAPLNPAIRPYDSVFYRDITLGFTENTPAVVLSTSSDGHMMTMQLSVGARPPEGSITFQPPPVADFTVMYETQPISLAGIMAVHTVVEAASTSYDPNSEFEITSLEWIAECDGTVEPDSFSENPTDPPEDVNSEKEKKPIFVFSTMEGAKITLVVESSSGEGATITKNLVPDVTEYFTRSLSMATSDGWKILAGATVGWRLFDEEGSCTAVPEINDEGPMVAGFSNGTFYVTLDRLATPPEKLYDFGSSAVRCIDVNQGDINFILAGVGDTLHRSTDGGVTWNAVHAFTDDIQYCESSPVNTLEIRVCAGQSEMISFDGGVTFSPFVVGMLGSTARKVASAPWGHLVVFTGTTNIADAARFEEDGKSIDWSLIPELERPVDLATVTPLQYEEGYMLASGAANSIVRDGLYQQLTYLAAQDGNTFIYKAVHIGGGVFQVQPEVNTTAEGGPHKVVNTGGIFLIDEVDTVFRIGYGDVADPVLPPEILVLPHDTTSPDMYHYHPLSGWDFLPLPTSIASGVWKGVRANPVNPSEWIIWNDNAAYYTSNEGGTWIQLYLRTPPWEGDTVVQKLEITDVRFTGYQGNWVLTGFMFAAFGMKRYNAGYFVQGKGAVTINEWTLGTDFAGISNGSGFVSGLRAYANNGKAIGACTTVRADDIGGTLESTPTEWHHFKKLTVSKIFSTRYIPYDSYVDEDPYQVLAIWEDNIGHTPDYRTTPPEGKIAAGSSVARCKNGIFVGNRTGVAGVYNLLTAPHMAIVAAGGSTVGEIVAGSKRYGVGAPIWTLQPEGGETIGFSVMNSGGQWTTIIGPDAMQESGIAPIIALVERGA